MKKSLCKQLILATALMLLCIPAGAQYFYGVTDPASKRWKSLSGKRYSVICPNGTDSLAQRIHYALETLGPLSGIDSTAHPIPVLLHPYTALGNGTVVWAPKRMELNTMPPSSTYSHLWDEQLALHESRHIAQMQHLNRGFIRFMGNLIGEQSVGIAAGLYTPKWFLEGDAVIAETQYSNSGRGRTADFLAYYRLAFLKGEKHSWNYWRFGSYRNYVPDHYALGYLLNSTARIKSGNADYAWDVIREMRRNWYNPLVRDVSLRKVTGFTPRKLVKEAERFYTREWQKELEEHLPVVSTSTKIASSEHPGWYSEIISLTPINDSTVYSHIRSAGRNAGLYKIALHYNGKSSFELVRTQSSNILRGLSNNGSTIIWNELERDPRWSGVVYANIFRFDISSGRVSRVTRKSYIPSATMADKNRIAAIELSPEGESRISLIDLNGKRLHSYLSPEGGQAKEIEAVGDSLYCTVTTAEGTGLYSRKGEGWRCLIAPQRRTLRYIKYSELALSEERGREPVIYFSSDASGLMDIYAISVGSGVVKRVFTNMYGSNPLGACGDKLFLAELSRTGSELSICYPQAMEEEGQRDSIPGDYRFDVAETLAAQVAEEGSNSKEEYSLPKAEPYGKMGHLLRFHSWAPFWMDPDRLMAMSSDHLYEMASLGATLISQNTMGTATTIAGYSWHKGHSSVRKNGFHTGHFRFIWSGIYPVFEFLADVNTKDRIRVTAARDDNNKPKTKSEHLESPYMKLEGGIYIPLTFSSNGWQRGIIPQIAWKMENHRYNRLTPEGFTKDYNPYNQVRYTLQMYATRERAETALYPRLGAGTLFSYGHSPAAGKTFTPVMLMHNYFYLPGIALTHAIRVDLDWQKHFTTNRTFLTDNMITFPRGYSDDYIPEQMLKAGISYALPLYPGEIDLGLLAYIKRIELIPFADFARYRALGGSWGDINSYGADIMFNGHFLRIGAPVKIGARYARLQRNAANSGSLNNISLLLSIELGN